MLHLSTIRQYYDLGFKSVVGLVEELEQQIENLTSANQSPNHFHHLDQTIKSQQNEIQRLSETVENKSKEIFKLHQSRLQFQNKLELQLSKTRQLNKQLKIRIRELEYLLASGNSSTPKLDSHNSNLPPSLDPPWNKPKRTKSLRKKSGKQVGGIKGHQGFTLRKVSKPDLVIVHRVNICQHCRYSITPRKFIRFIKRQIFEIENGKLTVIEHQAEVKLCPLCRKSFEEQTRNFNYLNHLSIQSICKQ